MCWRRTLGFLVMPLPFAAVSPPCALAPADFLICRHETAAQRQRRRSVGTGGTPTQRVVTVAVATAVATGVVATGRPRRVMVARMVAMELAAMGSGRTVESGWRREVWWGRAAYRTTRRSQLGERPDEGRQALLGDANVP